jgi:hypothetical protein
VFTAQPDNLLDIDQNAPHTLVDLSQSTDLRAALLEFIHRAALGMQLRLGPGIPGTSGGCPLRRLFQINLVPSEVAKGGRSPFSSGKNYEVAEPEFVDLGQQRSCDLSRAPLPPLHALIE